MTSESGVSPERLERAAESCPYCESKDFVKRGVRENKHQTVQLYKCCNLGCGRAFTSRTIKGKQFPWPVVLDAVSYHNLGMGLIDDIITRYAESRVKMFRLEKSWKKFRHGYANENTKKGAGGFKY